MYVDSNTLNPKKFLKGATENEVNSTRRKR